MRRTLLGVITIVICGLIVLLFTHVVVCVDYKVGRNYVGAVCVDSVWLLTRMCVVWQRQEGVGVGAALRRIARFAHYNRTMAQALSLGVIAAVALPVHVIMVSFTSSFPY